ncbi:MAG: DUF177 domain-containing protein, partial [Paracoccaceae bacterium]
MTFDPIFSHPLRVASLPQRKPTRFSLQPTAEERAALARALGLLDLPKLSFAGELRPAGRSDFLLEAQLTADVVQPCVVSLQPVPASLSEPVTRRYLADWQEP